MIFETIFESTYTILGSIRIHQNLAEIDDSYDFHSSVL